jgi:hypothetical protein
MYLIQSKTNKYKHLVVLLFTFNLFFSKLNSQVILDHNNVSAHVSPSGTFFNNFSEGLAGYEVPKGSGLTPIFGAQFMFGAQDVNGSIYITSGGYPNNSTDIFSGPISGAYSDSTYINRWKNKVWKICKGDIDQFRLWWLCNNGQLTSGCDTVTIPNLEALNVIYDWPAHGDVSVGESYWLAPFYDFNSDGNYNPDDGDYPLIKGCCATYMIQNDAAGSHTYSNTQDSMGIEVHTMIYAYNTADEINDATFIDVTVYNRGLVNYYLFKMGLLVDADLGNYTDDFFGCDSSSNTMLFYNADNDDESDMGYGAYPPAIGIISLEQPMSSFQNPGMVLGTPTERKQQYWNILNGLNEDGTPYIHPNGYPTNYVFSGDPTIPTDWTAAGIGYSAADCRGLMMSPSLSLAPGQFVSNSYAIVYERSGGNHLENASALLNRVPFYINAFQTDLTSQCQDAYLEISEKPEIQTTFNIYPNPTSGNLTISEISLSLIGQKGTIIDLNGKQILDFEITQQQQQIDCSSMKKGIYFLRIGEVFQKIMVE